MAKKLSEVADDHDQQLAQAVRTSAQQIWQAGLGAFVKAEKEQQAGGEQDFQRLVAEGSVLQQRVRATSDPAEEEGTEEASSGQPAGRSWDKLEQVFEDRVVRALGAIGVPARRDLDALAAQVAALAEQVRVLQARLDEDHGRN